MTEQKKYRPVSTIPSPQGGRDAGPECVLAEPVRKNVRALRALQARSSYYTEQERFNFIQEMRWEEEYVAHRIPQTKKVTNEKGELVEVETGAVLTVLKPAGLARFEFLDEAAKLVFIGAPVEGNEDHLNYQEIERGLEDFEGFFAKRSSGRGA